MNEAAIFDNPPVLSRSKRLKAATGDTHERLDRAIMAGEPFSSRDRYVLFVKMQHGFHRDIDALYDDAELDALLPDLAGRRRLPLIEGDLADLRMGALTFDASPAFAAGTSLDLATALGWLYVAEGSNLGAAFLLKDAQKLGFSETFGARHLAGAPEGRGLHWRTFTAALDAVHLSDEDEARVIAGAQSAFRRVHGLVRKVFAVSR
ncbi:biliverdin-producing heme oxygenase [Aquamicrobium defluvii]|uniref:Heme oxygenase n=1 Tax=Aquamicrobium defluvii TaxID=69279 RepID=A0A011SQL9_9HYPH|nr:biliverdin-producing heme oxygenase [Aquamicrobium defluvii]EXL01459.1 heme oxygenase [Aquamicrobium defluvii]EZQ13575.1 heme oxygenase [Halopseudomonas bauzanensis]TDR30938.1 heme oxygenase [Aquamicrobium defluvii]